MIYKLDDSSHLGEITLTVDNGLSFTPKVTGLEEVKEVILYDSSLIKELINNRFLKKYKKLVALVISILQDNDSSTGDIKIALDEIAKQKQIMHNKYARYLKEKELTDYIHKLDYLELELKNKYLVNSLMHNRLNNEEIDYEMEERKGKSR